MPPPVLHAPPVPYVELGSNWYLRGDFTYRTFDVAGTDGPEDAAGLGIGVGYQFASWLRGDVTLDYQFSSRFSALDAPIVANTKLWSSSLFANVTVNVTSVVEPDCTTVVGLADLLSVVGLIVGGMSG